MKRSIATYTGDTPPVHDLVHWTHQPIALAPTPGRPDAHGCWSGCIVDDDGTPTMIYSGNPPVNGPHLQVPCLAFGDEGLIRWQKYEHNPVNAIAPADLDLLEFRDHSAWKDGDEWYQVIGAGIRDVGGAALLFRSRDLREWEYLQPIATGDATRTEPHWTGTVWECPDFFRLADKHVLSVSVWSEMITHYVTYMIGSYADHSLQIEREGFVDLGSSFYAPQSMTDAAGRRIMFGWLREARPVAAQRVAEWSGVQSLPRIMSLIPDGDLRQQPAPELAVLRGERVRLDDLTVVDGVEQSVTGAEGRQLEIVLRCERGDANLIGIKVCCAPDGSEETAIIYDYATQQLAVDRTRSSLNAEVARDVQGRRFVLPDGEALTLHIFVDGSVIEVFANERACLTERIYPEGAESVGVKVFAQGGTATVERMDIWTLNSIW